MMLRSFITLKLEYHGLHAKLFPISGYFKSHRIVTGRDEWFSRCEKDFSWGSWCSRSSLSDGVDGIFR